MREITLRGRKAAGRVALVDDEDYELVAAHSWWVLEFERKGRKAGPYAYTKVRRDDGRQTWLYMHNLIMGRKWIDHIDHGGLNNQRHNLRAASRAQNQHNQQARPPASSRYKGVHWHTKGRKWRAAISVNGKGRHLGMFVSEEAAALAYNAAALEAFGPFACLNQIDSRAA